MSISSSPSGLQTVTTHVLETGTHHYHVFTSVAHGVLRLARIETVSATAWIIVQVQYLATSARSLYLPLSGEAIVMEQVMM